MRSHSVGCHALLQGIFPVQRLNPGLPHCRWIRFCPNHQGNSCPYKKIGAFPNQLLGITLMVIPWKKRLLTKLPLLRWSLVRAFQNVPVGLSPGLLPRWHCASAFISGDPAGQRNRESQPGHLTLTLWPAASVLILDTIGTVSLPFSFLLSCLSVSVLVSHTHSVSIVLMQAVSHSCKLTPFSRTHTLTLAFMVGFMKRVRAVRKMWQSEKVWADKCSKPGDTAWPVHSDSASCLRDEDVPFLWVWRGHLSYWVVCPASEEGQKVFLQRKVRKSFFRGRSESLSCTCHISNSFSLKIYAMSRCYIVGLCVLNPITKEIGFV